MKLSQIWQIKLLRKLDKIDIDEEHIFFALTLIIGVGSGVFAVLIAKSIDFIAHYFGTFDVPTLKSVAAGAAMVFISGYLTTRYFPETSGSGIPRTKIALVVHHGKIKSNEWIAKFVVSVLALSSGITLGREGPTVAVTSGLGSSIGRFFSLPKSKVKSLMAVGAAGGIAAAFNTPIAAVTFTLEEVLGNFNARAVGAIIISAVAAAVTGSMLHGSHPMFSVLKYKFEDPTELPLYLVVGIAAAILGPLWVRFVLRTREINEKIFKGHKLTIIMISFFAVTAMAIYTPLILSSGHDVINDVLLSQISDWKWIIILFGLKFFFTSLCYSSGISGGLFMPTLFMGAMIGSLVGLLAQQIHPNASDIGAFALVGMGAYFAVVIRAPITSILIIFEMTQDYKIILPLMIANISAYLMSFRYMDGSIYEMMSEQDGIHLPNKDDSEVLDAMTVEEAMVKEVISLNASLTVKEAMKIINRSEISGYPVINRKGLIHGVISTSEIGSAYAKFKGECEIGDICTRKVISVYPDQSLMMAFHYLNKYKISRLLVVSRINDKRLVGIITAEDIVNRFGYHISEESKAGVIDRYITEFDENNSPTV